MTPLPFLQLLQRRLASLLISLWLPVATVGLSGCGGAEKTVHTAVDVEPDPPPPKDVAEIARTITQARIVATLRVDSLRDHPAGKRLVRLGPVGTLLEQAGIDPLQEASLVYIASTGITHGDRAVAVVRHGLSEDALQSAIETILESSDPPGTWMEGTKTPAARLMVQGQDSILLLADEGLLVMLPGELEDQIQAFEGPLALTEPEGPEAFVADIQQPSESLRTKGSPPIPKTISRAEIRLTLREDGGADLIVDGQSESPEQAEADARSLMAAVDQALSVRVSVLRIRFFRSIPFRSEGDRVKAELSLSPGEVSRLLNLVETLSR